MKLSRRFKFYFQLASYIFCVIILIVTVGKTQAFLLILSALRILRNKTLKFSLNKFNFIYYLYTCIYKMDGNLIYKRISLNFSH